MGASQSAEKLVTLKSGRTRLFRSRQERRQIVEETMKPGASVVLVARKHGVNANQVFAWRRMYRNGRLEIVASAALLPSCHRCLPVSHDWSAVTGDSDPVRRPGDYALSPMGSTA